MVVQQFRNNRAAIYLLQAAFLPDDEALRAWQNWQQIGDIQNLPKGAYPLLPRLAGRIEHLAPLAPELPKLQGVRRKVWIQNQQNIRVLKHLLSLDSNAAILTGYYPQLHTHKSTAERPIHLVKVLSKTPSLAPLHGLSRSAVSRYFDEWTNQTGLRLRVYRKLPPPLLPAKPTFAPILIDGVDGRQLALRGQILWLSAEITMGRQQLPIAELATLIMLLGQLNDVDAWQGLYSVAQQVGRTQMLRRIVGLLDLLEVPIVPQAFRRQLNDAQPTAVERWFLRNWQKVPNKRTTLFRLYLFGKLQLATLRGQ